MPKKDEGTPEGDGPRLLAGGNPQIPKGDGNAPVQAYIAAMPGWKSDVGRQLDALIERTVPHVRKAVKWNQPLYGVEDQGFFVSFRCFTNYIKLTFFRGSALEPLPPVAFKDPNARARSTPFDCASRRRSWIYASASVRPPTTTVPGTGSTPSSSTRKSPL